MLTQIVTFLIFVAVIGCILYGRKLIKTEKVQVETSGGVMLMPPKNKEE